MSRGNGTGSWPRSAGPDLADDPRFATSAARKQHASALVQVLDAVFAQRDLADWRTRLDAAGVTFGGGAVGQRDRRR